MAEINARLSAVPKEELVQILVAVCGHATTRAHVENVLAYLDKKKSQEAEAAAMRRSSRSSTRASSEVSQSSLTTKPVKRKIKLCKLCEKPYEEKMNLNKSCSYHTGHWLIECEKDGLIWFDPEETVAEEFRADPNALRILSCCNAEKDMSKGCTVGKHVATVVEAQGRTINYEKAGSDH